MIQRLWVQTSQCVRYTTSLTNPIYKCHCKCQVQSWLYESFHHSHSQIFLSSVGWALEWWSRGCGFKPHRGQFLTKFNLFCVTWDLSDNLTEMRIMKNWVFTNHHFNALPTELGRNLLGRRFRKWVLFVSCNTSDVGLCTFLESIEHDWKWLDSQVVSLCSIKTILRMQRESTSWKYNIVPVENLQAANRYCINCA